MNFKIFPGTLNSREFREEEREGTITARLA